VLYERPRFSIIAAALTSDPVPWSKIPTRREAPDRQYRISMLGSGRAEVRE